MTTRFEDNRLNCGVGGLGSCKTVLKPSYDGLKLVIFSILASIFHFKNDFAATFIEIDQRETPNFEGSRLANKIGHVKLFSSDDFIIL